MKYIINYDEQGKILGFYNNYQSNDLNIEVENQTWIEAQNYNKIIINNKNISFKNVDWRTSKEIENEKQSIFRQERNTLLDKVDKEINKAEDLGQDTKVLRAYRQALRDATIEWVMPESVL